MTTAHELSSDAQLPNSLLEAAEQGEVVYLTRDERAVAAVVSLEVAAAGTAAIAALEDANDLALMREGRESGPSVSLEEFRKELGL